MNFVLVGFIPFSRLMCLFFLFLFLLLLRYVTIVLLIIRVFYKIIFSIVFVSFSCLFISNNYREIMKGEK